MVVATLALAAIVDLAIAAVLIVVGRAAWRRSHGRESRRAAALFAAWWYGLAGTVLTNALREAAGAAGVESSAWVLAALPWLHDAYIAALVVSVWGLLYYLIYLFSGRTGSFWPLTVFYALYGAVAFWLLAGMDVSGLSVGKWFVGWSYAHPETGGALLLVMTLLLLLPQIGAALAYATLLRRVREPGPRRRIAIVSAALAGWLGLTLLAPFLQLGRFEWWQAGGRLVGLAAAVAILYAYLSTPPAVGRLPPARMDPALLARVKDLV